MTGSRPSSRLGPRYQVRCCAPHHRLPRDSTGHRHPHYRTDRTNGRLLLSNSHHSARINNTAALRFSGFDAGPRIRPPIAGIRGTEPEELLTRGASHRKTAGLTRPSTCIYRARVRLYLVVERAVPRPRTIYTRTG